MLPSGRHPEQGAQFLWLTMTALVTRSPKIRASATRGSMERANAKTIALSKWI